MNKKTQQDAKNADRKERLGAALRANLQRRKQAARELKLSQTKSNATDATDNSDGKE